MHSHKTNNSTLNSSKDKDSSKMANILAAEPNAEIADVAEETGIKRGTTYTRIHDFCTLYKKTLDRDSFPEDLLTFYNRFSQTDDERLTKEEVLKLKELPKRMWPEKYPTAQKQPQKQQIQINQQPAIENSYQQML
jgi:hypothetical protein